MNHIRFITNTSKAEVTKEGGKYVLRGVPYTVDNMAMNGIGYMSAANAEVSSKYIGHPLTLTHPKDEEGRNTSVFTKEGIDFLAGGKITATYNKSGVWFFNAWIDEAELRAKKGDGKATGEYFANRLEQGLPIGISTGLFFETNNKSGKDKFGTEYRMEAMNQEPDHIALLHEDERPAGGEHTMIVTNSDGMQLTINLDEAQEDAEQSLINKVKDAVITFLHKDKQSGYNKGDNVLTLEENHDMSVTLEQLQEALAANQAATAETIASAVNAAVEPLKQQITVLEQAANASKDNELKELKERATKAGMNALLVNKLTIEDAPAVVELEAKQGQPAFNAQVGGKQEQSKLDHEIDLNAFITGESK